VGIFAIFPGTYNKSVIGPRLRARHWLGQQAETAMSVAVLNRMLAVATKIVVGLGNLDFVRLRATTPFGLRKHLQ
jgi:hypothetical protein